MLPGARSSVFFLFVTAGIMFSTLSHGKDSVTWMEAVAPPFFIHEGEYKGQGYEDLVTDILREHLTEYIHETIVTNIARHYYKFKQGEKVCNVGLYKTPEREKFLYFSIPSFFTLPTVIITRKDKLADFGNTKTVSLDEVLGNKQLIIGHAKDRSYGKAVDEVFARHEGQENIFILSGQELSLNFFKMLMLDRLDGLIGLPEEAMYQAEKLAIRDQIMTLTIKENQKGYAAWLSAVGCSKTEWGKKMIEDINRVLLEQRPADRYRSTYERWLDESSLENYRKLYKEVFLKSTE